jgi:hypothetical protein
MEPMNALPAKNGLEDPTTTAPGRRIVIVDGGVARAAAARAPRRADAEVELVHRRNLHILQPLLWQVAIAILAAAKIAAPIKDPSALKSEVARVSLAGRTGEPFFRRPGVRRLAFEFVIAVIASCLTTYVSRQPLTVRELLRTAHSVSLFAGPAVGVSLLALVALALAVFSARVIYILKLTSQASARDETRPRRQPQEPIGETPSRPIDPQHPIFGGEEAVQ